MSEETHKVYLAVPGVNYCWGTVTGVVKSTKQHVAYPHHGGFGFSGVEDFNILWSDAHNEYERGNVTHFAMLHGDITPDPAQHWLDILLEEMDARQASLVSAVSPIKDNRGLSSTGIADINDPWRPWRRFTMREIHELLPETFDAAAAGYPNRPLLHNTGLWACDLRRPEFHKANEAGELDLYFGFPTRAIRGDDGAWQHQRESEDWLFSRDLFTRGILDTYVTRRIRLTHHGKMDFTNGPGWGNFVDGDDNTADKWRVELDKKPLRMLQFIDWELGDACNLHTQHPECPNRHPDRYASLESAEEVYDLEIVHSSAEAYNLLGFTGFIGWHYYNEPLLYARRMFRLMRIIKVQAPAARFILWTNGTLIPEECDDYRLFSQIVISGYGAESKRGRDRLTAKGIKSRYLDDPQFDTRLLRLEPQNPASPCLRPFLELVFDAYGNSHLCCYDWQGKATLGSIHKLQIGEIARRWREAIEHISGKEMTADAPAFCRGCGHRWDKYQSHDEGITERARRWRKALAEGDR